jgi:hypothetical protein
VRGVERRRRADGADAFVRFLQQGRIDQRADLPQRRVERQTPGSRLARGLACVGTCPPGVASAAAGEQQTAQIDQDARARFPGAPARQCAGDIAQQALGGGMASRTGECVRPPCPLQLLGHGR